MADMQPWQIGASGGAAMGAGLGAMFAPWENPAKAANPYFNKIPDYLKQYLGPYIEAGNRALPNMEREYGSLTSNPGARINQIGQDFQQSPGFNFALQNALRAAGHASAAGGMAGSPQHEFQNMDIATQMANQNYNTWLTNALDAYKFGLTGTGDIYKTGAQTGVTMGEDLASTAAQRAKLEYEAQQAENEREGGMWGSFMGGAGQLAALAAFL